MLLKRLPDMQWDETAEAACMRGWPFRSFWLQHVKFAPGTPCNAWRIGQRESRRLARHCTLNGLRMPTPGPTMPQFAISERQTNGGRACESW